VVRNLELDPAALAVESFAVAATEVAETLPTTLRTFERDCTYPDLCGGTTA
jgi:hypothetical protein